MAARSSKSLDCLTSHELCDFLINKKVLDENQTEEILGEFITLISRVSLSLTVVTALPGFVPPSPDSNLLQKEKLMVQPS
jgi:hypothetical protein